MSPDELQRYRRQLCKRLADGITEEGMRALQEWSAAKRASVFSLIESEDDEIKAAKYRGQLSAFKEIGNLDNEIKRLLSDDFTG